ncbi:MAG: hypothetical protein NTW95_00250 [Candidatus Aminicenantes bacterium]|nr:hypothetical protein [Candidatus Aminicenantes bacterium]
MISKMKRVSNEEKKSLALWAADRAEKVLANFEEYCPEDDRPQKAIAAARAWARGGMKMIEARRCAVAAHAAARQATVPAAVAAARSAGHAAATAHAGGHAKAAASYAVKSKALRAEG